MLNIIGVVIDTNILVHADNEGNDKCDSCRKVLDHIAEQNIKIFVDELCNIDESKNTSRIVSEYIEHCRFGDVGYAFLLGAFTRYAITDVEEVQYKKFKRHFRQTVRNKTDIIFLAVTMATPDKVLLSNDLEDLQKPKRRVWQRSHGLLVVCSNEV